MLHLYKIPFQGNDIFIKNIDVHTDAIEYEIRDSDGNVVVPMHETSVAVLDDRIIFEGIGLSMPTVQKILETLGIIEVKAA